jgi:hypothetical protein
MMTFNDSLGFNDVGVLDKSVEPLHKGLDLRVWRHGGEEAVAPIRSSNNQEVAANLVREATRTTQTFWERVWVKR